MPECASIEFCSDLKRVLSNVGAADDIDDTCSDTNVCEAVIHNCRVLVDRTDPDTFDVVLEFLQKLHGGKLPLDSGQVASNLILREPPFRCPELDIDIHQPCRVGSCAFHTDYVWSRNCILAYLVDHKRDELDVKELTFLTGHTTAEVKQIQKMAMQHLREIVLRDRVKDEDRVDQQFTDDTCCYCSEILKETYRDVDGLLYCSQACYKLKPPIDFELERNFGLPVDRILEISVQCFAALKPVTHALGVSLPQLRQICDRYCVDISHLT